MWKRSGAAERDGPDARRARRGSTRSSPALAEREWALEDEELEPGVRGLAAPIRDYARAGRGRDRQSRGPGIPAARSSASRPSSPSSSVPPPGTSQAPGLRRHRRATPIDRRWRRARAGGGDGARRPAPSATTAAPSSAVAAAPSCEARASWHSDRAGGARRLRRAEPAGESSDAATSRSHGGWRRGGRRPAWSPLGRGFRAAGPQASSAGTSRLTPLALAVGVGLSRALARPSASPAGRRDSRTLGAGRGGRRAPWSRCCSWGRHGAGRAASVGVRVDDGAGRAGRAPGAATRSSASTETGGGRPVRLGPAGRCRARSARWSAGRCARDDAGVAGFVVASAAVCRISLRIRLTAAGRRSSRSAGLAVPLVVITAGTTDGVAARVERGGLARAGRVRRGEPLDGTAARPCGARPRR